MVRWWYSIMISRIFTASSHGNTTKIRFVSGHFWLFKKFCVSILRAKLYCSVLLTRISHCRKQRAPKTPVAKKTYKPNRTFISGDAWLTDVDVLLEYPRLIFHNCGRFLLTRFRIVAKTFKYWVWFTAWPSKIHSVVTMPLMSKKWFAWL